MKPFYQDEFTTIYQGNSLEILPTLQGIGSIVADPPYGVNFTMGKLKKGPKQKAHRKFVGSNLVAGDDEQFNPVHLLEYETVVLFGANNYARLLPHSRGWLFWDKKPLGVPNNSFSDGEMAWTNQDKPVRVFRHQWQGVLRASQNGDEHYHPTEKPIALMSWVIQKTQPRAIICDPYCGSGSTLIAAKQLGLKAIGIELVEEYCEIAAKRVQGATVMHPAFTGQPNNGMHATAQPSLPAQGSLFNDVDSGGA